MDYEKAYKDAIKTAKDFLNSPRTCFDIDQLEEIFPELREREDERIRKEIIDYLGLVGKGKGDYAQPMIDRWIAYLEKLNDFQFDYPGLYFYDGKKLHFQGNPAMEENPYDFAMSQQEKQKEPIDPFDTKLFQDGVKEGRRLEREDIKKEHPKIDLREFINKIDSFKARYKHPESISIKGAMAFMARMFYQYPNTARDWYESLPKATMDNARKEE